MNYNRIILIMLCAAVASCKKPKGQPPVVPEEPTVITYDNYSALKPGNYWIYQHYKVDILADTASPQNVYDSCYVEKDTIINGKTYAKYCSWSSASQYDLDVSFLRDSLHYIVNNGGRIIFSSEDFTSVFLDMPFGPNGATLDTMNVKCKMTASNVSVTVPAGTFLTSVSSQIFSYQPCQAKSPVYRNEWYAKNIGKVKATFGIYLSQPYVQYEQWLVRYYVQ